MKKTSATRKKASKKRVSKKRNVNKSAAIREYKANHPDAKPADIAAALQAKGIDVKPGVVSSTLYMARKKGQSLGRTSKGPQGTRGRRGDDMMDALLAAKKLADKLGGIQRARKALDMLERLQ